MIRGITFAEQVFYSADFAHYMNFFLNGGVGVTKGCAITNNGVNVTIDTGYFVAHGRLMNVEVAETIEPSQGYADGYNRIVYEIDLSKENTITEFNQGCIKVLNTEALVQEDLDAGGKVYQFPLCHFQWDGAAISGFVVDAPTLVLDDIFAQWSDNYAAINAQFDAWFAQQKSDFGDYAEQKKQELNAIYTEAEGVISGLEAGGFEKKAVYYAATMSAENWNIEEKTYSFETAYPFANYDIVIEPNGDLATAEQVEAYGGAMLVGSRTANVAKAIGDVPKIDIPIIVKAVKKYA